MPYTRGMLKTRAKRDEKSLKMSYMKEMPSWRFKKVSV